MAPRRAPARPSSCRRAAARSRRRLPVRPGLDRQGLRRLERQLRQPVGGGRAVRDQQRPGRRESRAPGWNCGRAHLAGEHRQDHHRPRAGHERRRAGNRRLRTRRRDLPRRRSAARIHGSGRRGRRRGRRDVPDRQPGRRPRGARHRRAEGDDDQRRHPDDLRQRRGDRLHRHRAAGRDQRRCQGACHVRDDSGAWRAAHGSHQARRRSGYAAAHAESGVRREAARLRIVQRQARRCRRHRPAGTRVVDGQAASRDDGHRRGRHWHRRGHSRHAGESRRRRWRTHGGSFRSSVRHVARRRRGQARW